MNQRLGIILGGILVLIVAGAVIYQLDKNESDTYGALPTSSPAQSPEKLIDLDESPSPQPSPSFAQGSSTAQSTSASAQGSGETQQFPIINKKDEQPKTMQEQPKKYQVILHTTKGDITINLSDTSTPKTVANFVSLASKGFYNSTIFHRVIKGFMIQGGDPECNPEKKSDMCGAGGPGYKFEDEPFEGSYTRGTVAMANSGPNTNGSQFFIMHADYNLPKNYTIFGKVTTGLEVVDAIATAQMTVGGDGALSKPLEPVRITSAEVKEIK